MIAKGCVSIYVAGLILEAIVLVASGGLADYEPYYVPLTALLSLAVVLHFNAPKSTKETVAIITVCVLSIWALWFVIVYVPSTQSDRVSGGVTTTSLVNDGYHTPVTVWVKNDSREDKYVVFTLTVQYPDGSTERESSNPGSAWSGIVVSHGESFQEALDFWFDTDRTGQLIQIIGCQIEINGESAPVRFSGHGTTKTCSLR